MVYAYVYVFANKKIISWIALQIDNISCNDWCNTPD